MDKEDSEEVSLPRSSETDSMFKKTSTSLKKSIEESSDNITEPVIEKLDNPDTDMNSTKVVTEEAAVETTTSAVESESDNEEAQKSDDVNLNSDECDKAAPEKSIETTSSDQVDSSATINQTETADETNGVDKPSVPIQTYLWEDVKRAKEQGGYPWTHLYKQPFDPSIAPEVILKYRYSPRSRRKGESYPSFDSEGSLEPDKEEVQSHIIVDEATAVEPQETSKTQVEEPEPEPTSAVAVVKVDEEIPPTVATSEPNRTATPATTEQPKESSSRKSSFTKIDSGSLKRKIKNPLDKIKKMADNLSMKKVKMPTIPKYPFRKGDIVLNEELKIGKLKESPKAEHREITSYVFKHQDSDESVSSIDIVELEESPMESRRRNIILTPDEIIDLPAKRDASVASTIDTTDLTLSETSSASPRKSTSPGIHGYADIEAYIAHITTDIEHVDRSSRINEFKLTRQDDIMSLPDDPIFDEFSRAMNKSIRKSLSAQDEKLRHELGKQRAPKMDELGMQSSEEDKLDDTTPSNALKPSSHHLLAPISSIDSTSSDEHSRAHLSALAEESESSDKRKSFETEPSVDIEVESLKNDNESLNNDDAVSDISTTLIEDEMKALEHSTIVVPAAEEEAAASPSSIDEKLTITVDEPIEMVKPLEETSTTSTETMIKPSGNKEDDSGGDDGGEKKNLELESNQQTDESAVKEDIIVRSGSAEPAKKISSRWSKIGDHDYEPIGEPQPQPEQTINLENDPAAAAAAHKRKIAEDEMNLEIEAKLLKTSTLSASDGDNISAQDIQDEMESHFFKHEIAPIATNAPIHPENTFDEAVIIDESPVKREIPQKKRNFMASAQETGKTLQKKMKASADALKSSINSKLSKNSKPPMPTVSVTQHVDTEPVDDDTQAILETTTVPRKNKFNFRVPNLKKIENFKINEQFSKIRQLGRSKSVPRDDSMTESTSVATPEITSAEPTSSKKKFDFGTYPRLIRDKFKRPKLPAERSDVSVRSDTPPAMEFTNEQFARRGPVASRWPEFEQHRNSGQYQQFASESSDYNEREMSLERRMRLDDLDGRTTEEREDFAIVARLISEEQRQLNEMDKENQEIHAHARKERYNDKKQPLPPPRREQREPSADDVASDEWSGMLNRDVSEAEFELQNNALKSDDANINRSYTPQTNQETQSSGSSGHRRRIAEGFDDDEEEDYFMRDTHKFSNGDEFLDKDENALMQIGEDNDAHQQRTVPDKPTRRSKRSLEKDTFFPPARPSRKSKQSESDFGNDDEICDEIELDFRVQGEEEEYFDDEMEFQRQSLKGLEHPDLSFDRDDFDHSMDDPKHPSNLPVPPTPPRRRKKKVVRPMNDYQQQQQHRDEIVVLQSKNILGNNRANVYCSEPHIAPLVQEEHYTTPTPTPRTRSRSNFSSRTLDDARSMSFQRDSFEAFHLHDNKENDYAQIRRRASPACPVRRKRSTKSLGASIPHFNDDEEEDERVAAPPRPKRNYSTIPHRPPRRKSAGSLVEISKTIKPDEDDYEEIMGNDKDANIIADERLISGDIVNRMKDRPLPPPPRPKRENKRFSRKSDFDDEENDEKFDKDENAEKIVELRDNDVVQEQRQQQPSNDEKIINEADNLEALRVETSFDDVEHEIIGSFEADQIMPRQESDELSEPIVEFEVSTQTDFVPYEELIDEDDEEGYLSEGKIKTLEDILKEEQEAEMERARWSRQLEEAENLSRGIERFRESNQRSFSEKSRTSGARSRSTSRPITPSAVVVEHRKSSPIIADNVQQTLTEAGLFVHPITYDDYGIKLDDEEEMQAEVEAEIEAAIADEQQPPVVEHEPDITDVNNNNFEEEERPTYDEVDHVAAAEMIDRSSLENLDREIEETFERISAEVFEKRADDEVDAKECAVIDAVVDEEFDDEMQRKIEEMIESVMNSAREEVDWIRGREQRAEKVDNEVEKLKSAQVTMETAPEKVEEGVHAETQHHIEEVVEVADTKVEQIEIQPAEEEEDLAVESEMEMLAESPSEEQLVLIEREPIKPFDEFQPLEEFKPISPSPPTFTADSHDDELEQVQIEQIPSPEPVVELECISQATAVQDESANVTVVSPPPQVPPRKKSSVTTSMEDFISKMELVGSQEMPKLEESRHEEEEFELKNIAHIEVNTEPTGGSSAAPRLPSRLHIDTLEIDNLSVSSLQAGRISASEIDTNSIAACEFESKSANMPIPAPIVQIPQQPVPTFTIPESFIDEIVERVVRSTNQAMQEHQQHLQQQQQQQNQQVQTEAASPSLPQEYTTIPQSFYQLRDPSDAEIVEKSPQQQRRRRHQRSLSTSEEEYQREQRTKTRSGKDSSSSAAQPSVAALGGQFLSACGSALREQGSHLMEALRASSKDENKRDLHVAILILVIIVAGLFLMGTDPSNVHYHWDFTNLPDASPRK